MSPRRGRNRGVDRRVIRVIREGIPGVTPEVIQETTPDMIPETTPEVIPETTPDMAQETTRDTPEADRVTTLAIEEAVVIATTSLSCNKHVKNDLV